MKHHYLTTILFVLFGSILTVVNAQIINNNPCYFDQYTNNYSIKNTEKAIQAAILNNMESEKNDHDSIRTIPVVVHVLHTGTASNISLEQIETQIEILNEDFRKLAGSNGDGNGVDSQVQFCLAKIDPNGNCTDGVVRINTPLANHNTYERAMLKLLSFWDNTRYMNIYVVKSINGGILGYSSFPGGPDEEDGMVVRHNVFGNIGTSSSSQGRTTTHEIGHWLGLYHTFNNGCGDDVCTDGDYVCDTPPQASPSFSCATLNTCSNDSPDLDDLKENYMNYTPDACKDMFTDGQRLRVLAALDTVRTLIWTAENLISTGCDSSYVAPEICQVSANFVTLTPDVCEGNEVTFMDISLNNATSWTWSFEGALPSTSELQNPTVTYNNLGEYSVTLMVSDGTTADTLQIDNYIIVSVPGVGEDLPLVENFDSGTFPTDNFTISNYDGGVTWGLDSMAFVSGDYSIKIDNYINTNYGSADDILLKYLNFTSVEGSELEMTFDWAYARSDPSFSDEMIVLLSIDCGTNFEQIYYKSGNALTTGPTQTTPFIPDSTQWNHAEISLDEYANEQYVLIKIVNITDGGNNLYIDNINIGEVLVGVSENELEDSFRMYPNPAQDMVTITLDSKYVRNVISIINSLGELVYQKESNNENLIEIKTSNFPTGVYMLNIKNEEIESTKKLIITR